MLLFCGYLMIRHSLIIPENEEIYNDVLTSTALSNRKIVYTEWTNSKIAMEVSGIYEYIFRDLYLSLLSTKNVNKANEYVEKHIGKYLNQTLEKNEYYGLFENKNLILVMMESADDWQINEKSTPTIYKMKEEGINFTNHHSPHYVTGKTAQSEFMANTGIYPKFNSVLPHYGYVDNNYKYSLANLFKEKGYRVNAFHRSYGSIYNRENMMLSLGYEKYYNVGALNLVEEEFDLDTSYARKVYDAMTQNGGENKFMSFFLTFSNHPEYSLEKETCKKHYDEMKKLFKNEMDDQKLCGYAQIHETDLFFEELLEKLAEDDILNDTVIIAFSDHPNGLYLSENESDKINYTEMFIYNPEIKHEEISSLTSTINIYPMINNLFKLESPYFLCFI